MADQGKKQRKWGRNAKSGQNLRYKNEDRQQKSHIKRIERHLTQFPTDWPACKALERYRVAIGQFNRASVNDWLARINSPHRLTA